MENEIKETNENIQQPAQPPVKPEPVATPLGVPIKTIALIVLLAFIALILVYIAVFPKKANTPQSVVVTEVLSQQDTTLSISNTKQNGAIYSSDVMIDTGKNKIHAVQLELAFDPTQITNIGIVAGDFFSPAAELIKKIDSINGTISYAVSVPLGQGSKQGKGIVAKITYSPVSTQISTITAINFLPKTGVTSLTTGESLLKLTNDGIVEIKVPVQTAPVSTSSAQ